MRDSGVSRLCACDERVDDDGSYAVMGSLEHFNLALILAVRIRKAGALFGIGWGLGGFTPSSKDQARSAK